MECHTYSGLRKKCWGTFFKTAVIVSAGFETGSNMEGESSAKKYFDRPKRDRNSHLKDQTVYNGRYFFVSWGGCCYVFGSNWSISNFIVAIIQGKQSGMRCSLARTY